MNKFLSPLSQSLGFHFFLWGFLIPFLFFPSLATDTIESVMWGAELQLGYSKHPPLAAWLTYGCVKVFGGLHGAYVFSQIQVLVYLWGIWKLVEILQGISHAKAALIFSLTSFMVNVFVTKSNPETVQWALTPGFVWAYFSVLRHDTRYKTLGIMAGFLLLSKYSSLGILGVCGALLLKEKGFKNPRLWLSLGIFFLILSPHIAWLIAHDFPPLRYMGDRVAASFHPKQLLYFSIIPFASHAFSIGLTICQGGKIKYVAKDLLWLFLIPWLGTILLTVVTGSHIRGHWAYPLSALIPVLLASALPKISETLFSQGRVLVVLIALGVCGFHTALLKGYFPTSLTSRCFFDPKHMEKSLQGLLKGEIPQNIEGPTLLKGHLGYLYTDRSPHQGTLIINDVYEEFERDMKKHPKAKRYPSLLMSKDKKELTEFYVGFDKF